MIMKSFGYHGRINIKYLPRINHQIAYSNIYTWNCLQVTGIVPAVTLLGTPTNTCGAVGLAANSNRMLDVGYTDGL